MSDYLTKAKRPGSDEWEPVEMRDNYYGPHNYGVQFPDGHVYPDGDCEIIGEKPGETWEERFRKLWSNSFDGAGDAVDEVYDDLLSLVASEIQSAVEADRMRIAEQLKESGVTCPEAYGFEGRETYSDCGKCIVCSLLSLIHDTK